MCPKVVSGWESQNHVKSRRITSKTRPGGTILNRDQSLVFSVEFFLGTLFEVYFWVVNLILRKNTDT